MSAQSPQPAGNKGEDLRRKIDEAVRDAARRTEIGTPWRCRCWRVDAAGLAEDLGITVRTREGLRGRARWYRARPADPPTTPRLWDEAPVEVDIIDVRADLRDSVRRFAIMHEIGHAILHRDYAQLAREVCDSEQERFANTFAAELLIPRVHRTRIASEFRRAGDPAVLLRLAGSLGVSPRTLLRFAAHHAWLEGCDRVWLDIRSLPNRHTNRDRRLRIYDAILDRARWFLPRNRSVAGLLGDDSLFLHTDRRTLGGDACMDISYRTLEPPRRFVHRSVPVHLAALRLSHPSNGLGMELLATAELAAPA